MVGAIRKCRGEGIGNPWQPFECPPEQIVIGFVNVFGRAPGIGRIAVYQHSVFIPGRSTGFIFSPACGGCRVRRWLPRRRPELLSKGRPAILTSPRRPQKKDIAVRPHAACLRHSHISLCGPNRAFTRKNPPAMAKSSGRLVKMGESQEPSWKHDEHKNSTAG